MTKHDAEIVWVSDGQFTSGHYSRAHVWRFDGGQEVKGSSSPSVVRVPQSDPFGIDPEEALVASTSSCHMLWFLDFARRAGLDVAEYRDSPDGVMGAMDDGRIGLTRITLRPTITFAGTQPSAEQVTELHEKADHACFIAASLKTEVVVESGTFVANPA